MARDPYKYFRVEGRELLDELTRLLMQAEKRESDKALVAKLLRLAHTLKGAAQVVKQTAIAQAAHAIEDILAPHRDSPVSVPKEVAEEAIQRLAEIGVRIDALQSAREFRAVIKVYDARQRRRLKQSVWRSRRSKDSSQAFANSTCGSRQRAVKWSRLDEPKNSQRQLSATFRF
jgi:chemotaxis protein histidine kinase CheA